MTVNQEMLAEIHRTVGSIDAKLDNLMTRQENHERRLRKIEFKHARMAGFAAGVALLASFAWSMVKEKFMGRGD